MYLWQLLIVWRYLQIVLVHLRLCIRIHVARHSPVFSGSAPRLVAVAATAVFSLESLRPRAQTKETPGCIMQIKPITTGVWAGREGSIFCSIHRPTRVVGLRVRYQARYTTAYLYCSDTMPLCFRTIAGRLHAYRQKIHLRSNSLRLTERKLFFP